jgi:hypothetical protein
VIELGHVLGAGMPMNPARVFGPALVAGFWPHHWIYWVGPMSGACLAAIIYHLVLWPRDTARGIDPAAQIVPPTQQPES